MNFRILAKFLGALVLLESLAMACCALFAYVDTEGSHGDSTRVLLLSAGISCGLGVLLLLCGGEKIKKIPRREGVVVVGLGWILCGILGALPYCLGSPHLDAAGAFFESVSGFTTTGSTVISADPATGVDIASWPRGILLWRSVTQWLGGVGILVLFVAILSYLGMGSKSLFCNESSFQADESTTTRIRDTASMLLKVYIGITLVCALGLRLMGMTTYNAISHAFTTVSTGGFSPHNESIGYYAGWGNAVWIELWISFCMLICGVSFLIWVVMIHRHWKRLMNEEEGLVFAFLCLFSAVVMAFGVAAAQGIGFWQALRHTWFIVVSIATTTGFGTVDYGVWPAYCLVFLAILMLVGGSSGSTAGGFKTSRLLIFLKTARFEITRTFRPNRLFRIDVNGNRIGEAERNQTVFFIALYAAIVVLSTLIVAFLEITHKMDMLTAFGAVVATMSNIGPGFGRVGPTDNFASLLPVTKVFLSLLMILGRLELYALLVLFAPSLWKRY